jgi:hypothetical protein
MNRILRWSAPLPLLLLLIGCSQTPQPASESKPEAKKPPEPISAQSAFYKIFVQARSWASDAKPLRVGDIDVEEVKSQGGKTAAWEAVFVSESRAKSRRYTYSVIDLPPRNLREGVVAGPEDTWTGTGQVQPFVIQAFKTDSTQAYDVAIKRGADYAKKNPDMRIKFLLEWTKRFPNPAWRVYWGESISKSSYSIFVDAVTGEYLQTLQTSR